MILLDPPSPTVLLHVCCAPCSGAILEALAGQGISATIFWSNSNICTADENRKRLDTLLPYAGQLGIPVIVDEYDHSAWQCAVRGLENEPERGARCMQCFRFRLRRAAEYASREGIGCLTTSLASSRWKSLEQVDAAGIAACEGTGVLWWPMNWRKGGLQPRRSQIIKEQNFYNQTFCGCEYSFRQT